MDMDYNAIKLEDRELPHKFPSCCDGDDINLIEYFMILLRYRWMIILVVFLAGLLAVVWSLMLPNIYYSEATIALRENDNRSSAFEGFGGLGGIVASRLGLGGSGSLKKLEVVLNSRNISAQVIKKHELMPTLFSDDWNAENKCWFSENAPTLQDAQKKITSLIKISTDIRQGTISVGIEHKDPETANKIVKYYLLELSNSLREEVLRDASENMRFFEEQLVRTNDAFLREKIYALLAKEIEKETFAKAQQYFGFILVDPPIIPDFDKKIRPKRSMICTLSALVGFLTAVLLCFFIEYFNKIKSENPVKYGHIVKELKSWRPWNANF